MLNQIWKRAQALLLVVAALAMLYPAAQAAEPVRIGVIAPVATPPGKSFINGAKLARDQINAAGGVNGRPIKLFIFDDHASSSDAVRAFQRAVQQDHVVAVTGVFISEVALALEPWSGRLKTPLIITGAASTKIPKLVHDHYNQYKYTFQAFMNTQDMALTACAMAKDIFVHDFHYKTAAMFSEEAAWTKPFDEAVAKCLPKIGLKVVDRVRFPLDTTDYTPIFQRLATHHPDVIINAIAHTGVRPVSQWHDSQFPALMAGPDGEGSSGGFWKATNGAAQGLIVGGTISANGAALTSRTPAFYHAYLKKFHDVPAFSGYTTYDGVYLIKTAIEKAGSTAPEAMLKALQSVDMEGASGRIAFNGRNAPLTHALKYVRGVTGGVYFQWQDGKQVVVWPKRIAQGKVELPSYMQH